MIDDYKYPRTMDQAFPGHGDYACAVERPRKQNKWGFIACLVLIFCAMAAASI